MIENNEIEINKKRILIILQPSFISQTSEEKKEKTSCDFKQIDMYVNNLRFILKCTDKMLENCNFTIGVLLHDLIFVCYK